MSRELFERIDAVLDGASIPERHTYFQLKHFIIGKEQTHAAQLWQVVRELRARRETLESLQEQSGDVEDNINLARVKLARVKQHQDQIALDDHLDMLEYAVHTSKAERELRALYRTKSNLYSKVGYLSDEITYLLGAFEALSKTEPLKALDDVAAQQQYWNEKFTEELNLRLILRQPLDPDFVRTVMSLDDNAPVKQQMTAILQKVQDQMLADRERQKLAEEQLRISRSADGK